MMELLFSPVSSKIHCLPCCFNYSDCDTIQSFTTFVTSNVLICQLTTDHTVNMASFHDNGITLYVHIIFNHSITRS